MGEPDRIECRRLGGHRAFLGNRWIGAGKKGATRRRREHPRRPRDRGSYDLGTTLLDAALPGKLRQRGEALATSSNPTAWNAGSITWASKRPTDVAATGRNLAFFPPHVAYQPRRCPASPIGYIPYEFGSEVKKWT